METALREHAFDRRARWTLLALVLACFASLAWLVHPWYEAGDETNDAAIYVACARSILHGEGYSYLGEPFTVRPPGMSALAALVMSVRGADFRALNLLVAGFGVACIAFLFVHAQRRVGTLLAALVAIAVWTNVEFQRLCNQIMSDVPGAALVLACLAIERWVERKPSIARDVVLGIAIGASCYVRSIAILLVPAIVIARVWRAPPPRAWRELVLRRVVPLVVVVLAVKAPWDVRNALHHPAAPVDQNYLYSYSTAMWHVDGGDPSSPRRALTDIAARAPKRLEQVASLVGSRMRDDASVGWSIAGAVALAFALVTCVRRRESAETFAVLATGVLLVYFGFRDRLVLPIALIALPASIEGLQWTLARFAGRAADVVCAAVLVALPCLDFRPRAGWSSIERTHNAYAQLAADLDASLSPDARIASAVGWHLAVFLDRPVYSLFFGIRRASGNDGAERVIDRHGIDTVVVWPVVPADRGLLPWLEDRHAPGRRVGSAVVYRVRP